MPEESKITPTRIRTFAGDLDIERKKRKQMTQLADAEKEVPAAPVKKEIEASPKMASMAYDAAPKKVVTPAVKPVPAKDNKPVPKPIPKPIPKPAPPTNTKIPAFHELKKHQDTKPTPEKIVPTEAKKDHDESKKPNSDKIGLDSTVITDTKSGSFRLFPSIIDSIKSWFKNLAAKRKLKSIPIYTVSDANHRKGVIQKATSKTGTIFTADNETLKEQIRRRQKNAENVAEAETTWSPYTETGYALLEAPDRTTNVVVEYKKRMTLPIVSEEPTPWVNTEIKTEEVETLANKTETEQETEPTPWVNTEIKTEEVKTITTIKEPDPTPWVSAGTRIEEAVSETKETEGIIAEVDAETPTLLEVADNTPFTTQIPTTALDGENSDEVEKEEASEKPRSSSRLLDQIETNTLTITLLIMVVGFIAIIFITRAFLGVGDNRDTAQIPGITAKPILTDSQLVSVSLTPDNMNQLPQLIRNAVASAPTGFVELPIVSPDGNEVLASYLFETLQFHVAAALRQSITSARFVTVNQSDPALILQFVDKDTVLGGMLGWEKTIATDMKNIYSMPTEISGTFTDKSLGGIDVRSLTNSEEEILVYGFIGGNTLLIAPNTTIFTQLSQPEFSN